ncbi:MAG: flavin reductase family protein [Thermoanaerobaculia bacterium]
MVMDPARFRQALGHFASGVTVVTTEAEGVRHGMTVSAFCSLSLEPPLVLICIDKDASLHPVITSAANFAVNVLSADQDLHSRRFASRGDEKFEGIATHPGTLGAPLLDGALARIECRVHDRFDGGDHSIVVGEVVHAEIEEGDPLIYFRGGYAELK